MAQSQSRQIAAQSSLKTVLQWSESCNQCLTLKELISITNVVVDYVENGYSKEIGERLSMIDNYLKDEK
jgi:glutaredoxin-related protein